MRLPSQLALLATGVHCTASDKMPQNSWSSALVKQRLHRTKMREPTLFNFLQGWLTTKALALGQPRQPGRWLTARHCVRTGHGSKLPLA